MKHLKQIITTILIAAILITGISVDTTTVTAATTKGGEFTNGGSVTIKPGDELKLTVTDTNHEFKNSEKDDYDIVERYKWSSSDTSVLAVETDFYDERETNAFCVTLIGVSAGTATVTGKDKSGIHEDITMTVTVTLPKATAKQKKCKHKYKVTKKATCERGGIKTCKKCKYQKAIAKKAHQYVNRKVTTVEYDYYLTTWYCSGCDCENPLATHQAGRCPKRCDFAVTFCCDAKTGEVVPNAEYPIASTKEALDLLAEHGVENLKAGHSNHAGWGVNTFDDVGYGEGHTVTKTIQRCKNCGKDKA